MLERWATIQQNLLHGKDERSRKYKEELLGKNSTYEYTEEYNILSLIRNNVDWISIDEWDSRVNIHTRAKLYAQTYIEGILETMSRHDDLQKQKLKAQVDKTQGQST